MQKWEHKKLLLTFSIVVLTVVLVFAMSSQRSAIDFNSQIKPIINKNCIACHGGVKRQAEFSLLFRSEALKKTRSGKYAIVPGDPDHSEMIRRISLKDPEERMPYKHDPLSEHEISLLRKWIAQ